MKTLKVYSDGACSGNPGPGGYAAVIIDQGKVLQTIQGGEAETTNNRMELMATIKTLEYLNKHHTSETIEYYLDSQYVLKGITEWLDGWKRKNWKGAAGPVKNKDLWEQIDSFRHTLTITWIWVKGHAGNEFNEMVDQIAVAQVEKMRK